MAGANWDTINFFSKFFSNRNEKAQIFMNKPVYLGLSISEMSKIIMYEFWYDYVRQQYGEKANMLHGCR